MPLFDFRCHECRHDFELLIRGQETALCPQCGSSKAERLMSAAAAPASHGTSLPLASACPPPEMGPCRPGCCRIPAG